MKYIYLIITSALLMVACGGSSDGDTTPAEPPVVIPPSTPSAPTAASLVFPEANSLCTEAKDLTGNIGDTDRTYTINFRWNGKLNTKYAITLKNEDAGTEITTPSTTATSLDITEIVPGANYSWEVTASKTGTTKTTPSGKKTFTAAGIAQVSFAPKPAVAVSPNRNEILASTTTSVNLQWTGSDENGDIKEYDIYFGESSAALTEIKTVAVGTNSETVTVISGTFYSWKIVTRDEVGNEASSKYKLLHKTKATLNCSLFNT